MSKSRNQNSKRIPLTAANMYLDVYVSYDDGKGPGYHDGKEHKRGYKLHVQPVEVDRSQSGVTVTTARAWSGMQGFIESANRFSQTKMEQLAANAPTTDLYRRLVDRVLESNGLTVDSL